jgi:DNA (cytosine-5)-methyltransferase 1
MNYYNEWDSFAAEWLKQLIKDGLIPDGEVDSRSIADVRPEDLKGFTQCHFFAGIGGWSRALQLAGWSSDRPVWTGSPPCQSFSTAGKGKGKDDARHLWPVFFNLIRECQPPTVFGEQVAAAIRFGWLDDLQIDFEREGYASAAAVLPAGGIGAPHKRDRLFFVANSHSERLQRRQEARQQCSKFECDNRSEIRPFARSSAAVSTVADFHNERHERTSGDGRQAQRGSEHPSAVSMADTTSGRHKQSEQFSNGCSSQSDKRQSDSSGNCESQRQLMANSNGERCGGKEWGGEAEEKGQSERHSSERSGDSSVAYSKSGGRRQEQSDARRSGTGVGSQKHETGGLESGNTIGHSSVGDTNSDRPQSRHETSETAGHGNPINSASIWPDSVGNTEHDGSHEAEIGRSTGPEDEGRLLESQRSDTADSAGIRAETVGNPEHNGSHGAKVGRSPAEASNEWSRKGRTFPNNLREQVDPRSQEIYASGKIPQSSTAETESTAPSQLNPRFSLWLMGYPIEWAYSGERVTPLSRKRQPKS